MAALGGCKVYYSPISHPEENFLDDKSNGFQLEASRLRSAVALERLCLVLSLTTLYLTA